MNTNLKNTALKIYNAGLKAVIPDICIKRYLSLTTNRLRTGNVSFELDQINHIYLIGAGKASAAMDRTVETMFGNQICDGIIITKYGHGEPLEHCTLIEAGHPVPDENGVAAASALLTMVSKAKPDDLILCMVSGGASALTPSLPDGISLAAKQAVTLR